MPSLALFPTLLREAIGPREIKDRQPEPDLVMDGQDEVAAYTLVGRVDGPMAAVYLFHAAHISLVIEGCKTVVDLACGPGGETASRNIVLWRGYVARHAGKRARSRQRSRPFER